MSLWSKYFLSITQIESLAVQGLKCFYCPQERVALNAKTNGNGPVGIILPCTGQHTGTIVECTNHNIDDNTTSVSPWIAHGCIVGKRGSEMCSIYIILLLHWVIQWILLQINDNLILSNLDNSWYRQCAWRKPDWKLDDYKNKPITNAQYCVTPSNAAETSCNFWNQIRYCDTDLCNERAKGSQITGLEHMIVSNILMVFLFSCYLW